jgi:protein-L-isoaspartate(D-aspartate) O-methyltransferase
MERALHHQLFCKPEITMSEYATLRKAMIDRQIAGRGIRNVRLLEAFRAVPRELFVDPEQAPEAYDDHPLPIACGQTISQPYIVALMIDAAGVRPGDRVLEVGTGSGYAAAILGCVAREVIGIERHPELAALAAERMRRLGYGNVRIVEGDGTLGCPRHAPFDVILAAASGSHVPRVLTDQLAPGGRIVMPVGDPGTVQKLVKLTLAPDGRTVEEDLGPVRFVPLIGQEGWSDE